MQTLTLTEAAAFLKVNPEELRARAKRGLVPAAKVGPPLGVFGRRFGPARPLVISSATASAACGYNRGGYMSLRRRDKVWWIDVAAPNGERIRRTTGTCQKALAQEYHDRIKAELWRIDKLDAKPKRSWNDAVVRWCKENGHKATADEDVSKLRWLDRYLRDKDLKAIDRNVIDHVTKEKLSEGWKNATVNRTLELLRAILRKAVNEWEWLDRTPHVRMLKEPTRRIRFLTREEAQKLLAALPAAFGGHGGILTRNGVAGGECHRS